MAWQNFQPFVQGGASSVLAEGQILESQHSVIKYRGVTHAISRIFVEEGFLALYSGLGPAAVRQLIYGGLKRGLYKTFQNWTGVRGSKSTIAQDLILASSSGGISAFVCNPVDIMKVRMQTRGYSFTTCYRELIYVDGAKGLFRGACPNVLRTSVMVGFSFSMYDEVKRFILYDLRIDKGFWSYIIASCIASVTGSLAANPFDVIKSRMMNQKTGETRYTGMMQCALKTARSEGPTAFLKGYGTMLCRALPWHTVFFLANEYLW